MNFCIRAGQKAELYYDSREPEAVKIALCNLAKDLEKVLSGVEVVRREMCSGEGVVKHTEHTGILSVGVHSAELASVEMQSPEEQSIRVQDLEEQSTKGLGRMSEDMAESPDERTQEKALERIPGEIAARVTDGTVGEVSAGTIEESNTAIVVRTICGDSLKFETGIDYEKITDENGTLHREAYQLKVQKGKLYITGTDRRGTIYGIYTFCEWMGVSPWYFFGDVPVRKKQELVLEEGFCRTDWPSVEYRGIFINDEEELEAWVQKYFGEPTIGVKSYEKIFELLLRLKANYIWPAMHVNSFNQTPENGRLADRMGIVVGTSHCDMLMRSNNREWKPWIEKKGYTDAAYDYSIEGRNREILKEYWRESVEQNKDYEVCYTLGMRGIHDSGFETKSLAGKTKEEIRSAKVALLEKIIADQRAILESVLETKPMMTFIPYKEVLELYDNGLEIPEDMSLVWANDNYGYIRRYPSEKEKKRKGGNGIYYHNSYWAPPSMSYVFLCSIPLAHTRNELQKAWNEGIRKLWVLNCGAMKPLEQEITFFLNLAWEIGRTGGLTEDVDAWTEDWINRTFKVSGEEMKEISFGRAVSNLLNDFSQLTNVRKLENMDYDAFSQTAYGDEAAMRIHQYEELFARGNALYEKLPAEERDAFFQLVLMRIHAGYFTNLSYYYGDRSTLMYDRGNMQAAQYYTEKSREAEDARRRMLYYYNNAMNKGKWNGILNPEGFPPPRAAMMPVCTPPLEITGAPSMRVDVWNEEEEFVFYMPGEKWIEIGNRGAGEFKVCLQAPEWVELSDEQVAVRTERRILVHVSDVEENREGEILVENLQDGSLRRIPIRTIKAEDFEKYAVGKDWDRKDNISEDNGIGENNNVGENDGGNPAGNPAGKGDLYKDIIELEYTQDIYGVEEDGIIALESDWGISGSYPSHDPLREKEIWQESRYFGEKRDTDSLKTRLEGSDFRLIPRLGRMKGNLAEACVQREPEESGQAQSPDRAFGGEQAKPLCYGFSVHSTGRFLLEIHRFPSLNSVGRIRIGVSLDDGPVQIVESVSNDEWRGNWKTNVLNNVDRLYLPLHVSEQGKHRLFIWAVDKYFAFSRLVIYTKPRKENNLAGIRGPQPLPAEWDMKAWCEGFYGNCDLKPRPVYYASYENNKDTLAVLSQVKQEAHYGKQVEPVWYLNRGKQCFEETDGAIRIDAAAALAQSEWAWTRELRDMSAQNPVKNFENYFEKIQVQNSAKAQVPNCLWRHCSSESFGRSGLAMYIRTPGLTWKRPEISGPDSTDISCQTLEKACSRAPVEPPSLNYRIRCEGGEYTLWMLSKFNVREEGLYAVGFDGKILPGEELYGKGSLWRYEAEQVYRWVPVVPVLKLESGEHVLHIFALASGMRYDRFYMTRGRELPPEDTAWYYNL